uniref:Large ribosomal subunit protein uL6 n=1 Tax=Schistosoma japonicum TaxID=6182 RepID=C1LBF8_SCHJA|nr:Ribosomal protein L9 [Schistosoma japonicum]
MRIIKSSESVKIPPGIKAKAIKRVIYIKGPRRSLKRDFKHLSLDIRVFSKRIVVTKYFGNRKELAAVRTVCSHISNMIKGVTSGYRYKLKSVYAHFPINMIPSAEGSKLEIRNFLGEKANKFVLMEAGVKVSATGVKDEIQVEGNDIEKVAKCAALIQQSCRVRHKDIRKFLDGIYVSSKETIVSE